MDFHFSMLSRAALWSRVLCIYTVRLVLIFSLYCFTTAVPLLQGALILSADGLFSRSWQGPQQQIWLRSLGTVFATQGDSIDFPIDRQNSCHFPPLVVLLLRLLSYT